MEDISISLSARVESLMSRFFPNAKAVRGGWEIGSIYGEAGQSCKVYRQNDGMWFAKDFKTDDSVTMFGLLHAVLGNADWRDTFKVAEEFCGINGEFVPSAPRKRPVAPRVFVKQPIPESPKDQFPPVTLDTPSAAYLDGERDIELETMEKYRVMSNGNAWVAKFYDINDNYVSYKSTSISRGENGKKRIVGSKNPYSTLWGWWNVPADAEELIISEGELDAMSIDQMGCHCPVVSLPSGVSNLGWIENDSERLAKLKCIYLSFDMDEAGKAAAIRVAERLGIDRCLMLVLPRPYDDANSMLMSGFHDEHSVPDLLLSALTLEEFINYEQN